MNTSDAREHATSASGAKKIGFDSKSGQPMILKLVFTVSLLDAQFYRVVWRTDREERIFSRILHFRVVGFQATKNIEDCGNGDT